MLTTLSDLPQKCRKCAKSKTPRIHRNCRFCAELEFEESILCDLNRSVQEDADFQCHAFEPVLKLAGSPEAGATEGFDRPPERRRKEPYLKLFHSEKIKYERALALQRLNRDPDGVYVQLNYHLLWNVSHRTPVFKPGKNFFDIVHYTFTQSSEQVDGLVDLLHLAPDHIHLYVESEGEFSVEEIAKRIKRITGNAVLEKFPVINERLGENAEIWDEAYFVESIG